MKYSYLKKPIAPLLLILLTACVDDELIETADQSIRPARIMTVSRQSDDVIHEFTGRIDALQTVDLSFEVGGPLAELPVREGATVNAGSLIASLDDTAFRLAVKEAEVQLRLAAQDLNRKRKVLLENGIAKSQVEDARSNYELQKVRLSRAKESLADASIRSPFDAYVSRRYFDEHVNIRPGDPIVRLLDLTQLKVVINVPENMAATIRPGQLKAAWVEFPFAGDRRFDIQLYENQGEAAAMAQTYEATFTMDNPGEWNVLPGMTATAHIHIGSSDEGQILIPASAIVPAADNTLRVWVYEPEKQGVSSRAITTGAPQKGGIPVLKGLESNEQIVTTGASQLQPGMRIRPL